MSLSSQDTQRSSRFLIVAIALGYFMVMLDMTVVTVALPAIKHDLGGGVAGLQWVLDGYILVFGALLLSAGALADRIGARRTFTAGSWLFAITSALAGAAPSLAALVALRMLQGAGAAALLPASMALISRAYPEAGARARAVGSWAAISGCALAAGPLVGGALVAGIGWRAIFVVNLPVAALGALLSSRLLPRDTETHSVPVNVVGQAAAIVALAALAFACSETARRGAVSAGAAVGWGACAVAVVAFARSERSRRNPLLPSALLRIPTVSLGFVIGSVANFVLAGALFVLPLVFVQGRGWSPLAAGLAFLPLTLPTAFNPLLTSRLVARLGATRPLVAGFSLAAAGCALLAASAVHGAYLVIACALGLLGLGISFVLPALIAAVIGAAPGPYVGVASGALNASRQAGATVGVAIMGVAMAHNAVATGTAARALGILAAVALAGVPLTWAAKPRVSA